MSSFFKNTFFSDYSPLRRVVSQESHAAAGAQGLSEDDGRLSSAYEAFQHGRNQEAIRLYRQVSPEGFKVRPQDRYYYARACEHLGKYDESRTVASRAMLEIPPHDTDISFLRVLLGRVSYEKYMSVCAWRREPKDLEMAMAYMHDAHRESPKNGEISQQYSCMLLKHAAFYSDEFLWALRYAASDENLTKELLEGLKRGLSLSEVPNAAYVDMAHIAYRWDEHAFAMSLYEKSFSKNVFTTDDAMCFAFSAYCMGDLKKVRSLCEKILNEVGEIDLRNINDLATCAWVYNMLGTLAYKKYLSTCDSTDQHNAINFFRKSASLGFQRASQNVTLMRQHYLSAIIGPGVSASFVEGPRREPAIARPAIS